MISGLLDKLVFGGTLLVALQVPQLADHYQQFLAGYFEATKRQVDGYRLTAVQHEYADVYAMIDDHLQNASASVRMDAQQKLGTLDEFEDLKAATLMFDRGSVIEKAVYMFSPSRYPILDKTLENFKPGIPVTVEGILFGIIAGLILNVTISLPLSLLLKPMLLKSTSRKSTPLKPRSLSPKKREPVD